MRSEPMIYEPVSISLTDEEFAALVAIDGTMLQCRPFPDLERRLRQMGLIEPFRLSRLPIRTAKGEALVKANQPPPREELMRRSYVLTAHLAEGVAA
jgi:hypothetical protein